MKTLILLAFLSITFCAANAQSLVVEGVTPNLFIPHTVAPKENFYSIGRLYNQSPKVIAAFNELIMEKGLAIGQHIKIPLSNQNFEATDKVTAGEVLVPLTHIVSKGENIFKIGTGYNVTAQSIRQWNLLSSDNVPVGKALVIGHLKVKAAESSLAGGKSEGISQQIKVPPVAKVTAPVAVKQEPVVIAATSPVKNNNGTFSTIEEKKPVENAPVVTIKNEVEKSAQTNNSKVSNPVSTTPKEVSSGSITNDPGVKQNPVQAKTERANIDLSNTPASAAEGLFSAVYTNDQLHKSKSNKSGEAATFKSTSGWKDKKYYVLMNDVTPGTILKLSSTSNKVVYAKVLGSIPEMKENNGLLLRISNAGASYLGIADPRFPVEVTYYQ